MARPDIQLNLPKPRLTPQASPVDTYYQAKVPKTEGMVTSGWLTAAQALKVLSPSISGFLQDVEKKKRELVPEKAAEAVRGYKGEYKDLADMPTMSDEEWAAWFEENKAAFGGTIDLTYASRPDFILQFKTLGGIRDVKDSMRMTGTDGSQMSYLSYSYSKMDVLETPGFDVRAEQDKWHEEFTAGVDPETGQAWINGATRAMAAIDDEVARVAASKQDANRKVEDVHNRVQSYLELLDKLYTPRLEIEELEPPVDGESAAERTIRLGRNATLRKRILEGGAENMESLRAVFGSFSAVGGINGNAVFKDAVQLYVDQIIEEDGDMEDVEEFLEMVLTLELQNGKPLGADHYWTEAVMDIKDSAYLREKRRGNEDLTRSLTVSSTEGNVYDLLAQGSDGGLSGFEDLIEFVRENGGPELIREALLRQGHTAEIEGTINTGLQSMVKAWINDNEITSTQLGSNGRRVADELWNDLESNGWSEAWDAKLRSNMALLGGARENSEYRKLAKRASDLKSAGYRDENYKASSDLLANSIINKKAYDDLPTGEQLIIQRLLRDAQDKFTDGMHSINDPAEKREFLRTGWQDIAEKVKASPEYEKAIAEAITKNPRFVVDSNQRVLAEILAEVERQDPDHPQVESLDGLGFVRGPLDKLAGNRRRRAILELSELMYVVAESAIAANSDEEDSQKRNQLVHRELMRSLPDVIEGYYDQTSVNVGSVPQIQESQEALLTMESMRSTLTPKDVRNLGGGTEGVDGEAVAGMKAAARALEALPSAKFGGVDAYEYIDNMREAFGAPSIRYRESHNEERRQKPNAERDISMQNELARVEREDEAYPSRNRSEILYLSHYYHGGEKQRAEVGLFWLDFLDDDGDLISDIGVDLASLPARGITEKLRFAVTNRGLSFEEIERKSTREGVPLKDLFGSGWIKKLPLAVMHIGSNDPAVFEKDLAEWENLATRESSRYWKFMVSTGTTPDKPMKDVDEDIGLGRRPTHGEFFMHQLIQGHALKGRALGKQGMARIERPYSSIPRMQPDFTPGFGLRNVTNSFKAGDPRIYSIPIQETLRREQEWLDK